jgi:hypothetical protein
LKSKGFIPSPWPDAKGREWDVLFLSEDAMRRERRALSPPGKLERRDCNVYGPSKKAKERERGVLGRERPAFSPFQGSKSGE